VSSPLRVVLELGQRRLLRARPSLPGSAGLAGPPVTPEAPAEIEATLRKKAAALGADPRDAWEWTACIRAYAQAVPSTGAGAGVCRDPKDDPFLDAAVGGGAGCIVPAAGSSLLWASIGA